MTTCDISLRTLAEADIDEEPLFGPVTFHRLGLVVSAVFGLIAIIIALFLVFRHATNYTKPWEQKHIIRILFMIPIYAMVSFLSYYFYKHALYFEVIRDCYEAFALASFFTLMCHYIAPNLHEQKNYFRRLHPIKNWIIPINRCQKCAGGKDKGMFRIPKSGLTWFNIIWIGVFQYCLIRVVFTFVAMITQFFDRYCESSLSPVFGHIWVMVFETIGVTIAMYCLIQFYIQLKEDLAPNKPFLKICCIKLVIFFSFWQNIVISLLVTTKVIKPSEKLAYPDIKVGLPSMLLCVEMAIFAILHIFAFPAKPYRVTDSAMAKKSHGGFLGLYALMDAFNPWDIIKASGRGFRWLFIGYKHRREDISYQSTKMETMKNQEAVYNGPTFAGNGESAVDVSYPAPSGYYTDQRADGDDHARLITHAQPDPTAAPYRDNDYQPGPGGRDSDEDRGSSSSNQQATPTSSSSDAPGPHASDVDTSYHRPGPSSLPLPAPLPQSQPQRPVRRPADAPTSIPYPRESQIYPQVQPPYSPTQLREKPQDPQRQQGGPGAEWNMFGGGGMPEHGRGPGQGQRPSGAGSQNPSYRDV